MDKSSALAIEMRGISKRFSSVQALDKVDLVVEKGTIHALLGENGAGKSTLMKILYGLYSADSGQIFLDGEQVEIKNPAQAIARNIGMVHQHFMLVENFTVAENIILGREPHGPLGVLKQAEIEERINEFTSSYGLNVEANDLIKDISLASQQRVEILKALYRGAEILILDEPTAVLTPQEATALFATLRTLKEAGKTIIIITHKLKEIKAVADYCSILRRGKYIKTVKVDKVDKAQLAELMVGREVRLTSGKEALEAGEKILEVQNVSVYDKHKLAKLKNLSFDLCGSEIVAIAGIDGNGQTELIEVLTGLQNPDEGSIRLLDTDITRAKPKEIHDAGLRAIHEDRHKRGLVLDFTVSENTVLEAYPEERFSSPKLGILKAGAIRDYANSLIKRFDVRPADAADKKASNLSGGNQQKVIIAREVDADPAVLIACQPSRGLDVGAIEFVHRELLAQRANGKAILLVSFELDEVLDLADRILVIYEGEIVAELRPESTDEREIGLYMSGAKRQDEEAKVV